MHVADLSLPQTSSRALVKQSEWQPFGAWGTGHLDSQDGVLCAELRLATRRATRAETRRTIVVGMNECMYNDVCIMSDGMKWSKRVTTAGKPKHQISLFPKTEQTGKRKRKRQRRQEGRRKELTTSVVASYIAHDWTEHSQYLEP